MQTDSVRRAHERVSEQHKHIGDLIIAVEAAAMRGDGAGTVDAVLLHLVRYLELHFATEERLMTESSYAGLAAHTEEHLRCLTELRTLLGAVPSPCSTDLLKVMGYLRGWFSEHQLTADRQYMDFLSR